MAGELEEKEPTATAVIQLSLSMCHLLLRLLGHERLQLDVVVAVVGVLLLQQRSVFLVGLPSTPPCLACKHRVRSKDGGKYFWERWIGKLLVMPFF
jgi:hypothetical protein